MVSFGGIVELCFDFTAMAFPGCKRRCRVPSPQPCKKVAREEDRSGQPHQGGMNTTATPQGTSSAEWSSAGLNNLKPVQGVAFGASSPTPPDQDSSCSEWSCSIISVFCCGGPHARGQRPPSQGAMLSIEAPGPHPHLAPLPVSAASHVELHQTRQNSSIVSAARPQCMDAHVGHGCKVTAAGFACSSIDGNGSWQPAAAGGCLALRTPAPAAVAAASTRVCDGTSSRSCCALLDSHSGGHSGGHAGLQVNGAHVLNADQPRHVSGDRHLARVSCDGSLDANQQRFSFAELQCTAVGISRYASINNSRRGSYTGENMDVHGAPMAHAHGVARGSSCSPVETHFGLLPGTNLPQTVRQCCVLGPTHANSTEWGRLWGSQDSSCSQEHLPYPSLGHIRIPAAHSPQPMDNVSHPLSELHRSLTELRKSMSEMPKLVPTEAHNAGSGDHHYANASGHCVVGPVGMHGACNPGQGLVGMDVRLDRQDSCSSIEFARTGQLLGNNVLGSNAWSPGATLDHMEDVCLDNVSKPCSTACSASRGCNQLEIGYRGAGSRGGLSCSPEDDTEPEFGPLTSDLRPYPQLVQWTQELCTKQQQLQQWKQNRYADQQLRSRCLGGSSDVKNVRDVSHLKDTAWMEFGSGGVHSSAECFEANAFPAKGFHPKDFTSERLREQDLHQGSAHSDPRAHSSVLTVRPKTRSARDLLPWRKSYVQASHVQAELELSDVDDSPVGYQCMGNPHAGVKAGIRGGHPAKKEAPGMWSMSSFLSQSILKQSWSIGTAIQPGVTAVQHGQDTPRCSADSTGSGRTLRGSIFSWLLPSDETCSTSSASSSVDSYSRPQAISVHDALEQCGHGQQYRQGLSPGRLHRAGGMAPSRAVHQQPSSAGRLVKPSRRSAHGPNAADPQQGGWSRSHHCSFPNLPTSAHALPCSFTDEHTAGQLHFQPPRSAWLTNGRPADTDGIALTATNSMCSSRNPMFRSIQALPSSLHAKHSPSSMQIFHNAATHGYRYPCSSSSAAQLWQQEAQNMCRYPKQSYLDCNGTLKPPNRWSPSLQADRTWGGAFGGADAAGRIGMLRRQSSLSLSHRDWPDRDSSEEGAHSSCLPRWPCTEVFSPPVPRSPSMYQDLSCRRALDLANEVMACITLPDGVKYTAVRDDSPLYVLGLVYEFTAFDVALGSTYFQRLRQHFTSKEAQLADLVLGPPALRQARMGRHNFDQQRGSPYSCELACLSVLQFVSLFLAAKVLGSCVDVSSDTLRMHISRAFQLPVCTDTAMDVELLCLDGLHWRLGPYLQEDQLLWINDLEWL